MLDIFKLTLIEKVPDETVKLQAEIVQKKLLFVPMLNIDHLPSKLSTQITVHFEGGKMTLR